MFPTATILKKGVKPKVMDVFRDTIQTKSPTQFTLLNKQQYLFEVIKKKDIDEVEIGSFASNKVLPIMADTKKLLNLCYAMAPTKAYYILSPSHKQLVANLDESTYNKISGLSFITSASEQFQLKNVRKTQDATHTDIIQSLEYLGSFANRRPLTHKLYVSCVNRCPVSKSVVTHHAICATIAKYMPLIDQGYITNVCLSDTAGTLTAHDFKEIAELLACMGVPYNKMGLHLHVNTARLDEIIKILLTAFDKNIGHYDVTNMAGNDGGCAVTMNTAECYPNMSHELLCHVWDALKYKKI